MSSIWLDQLQSLRKQILSSSSALSAPSKDGFVKKITIIDSNKLADLSEWSKELHPTEFSDTCAQLYRILPDIVALKTDTDTRFSMLEQLHPIAMDACEGLRQLIFTDDSALDASKREALVIIQAIHKQLYAGYLSCFIDQCSRRKIKTSEIDSTTKAAGRALYSAACIVRNAYSVYGSAPSKIWLGLHSIYQICSDLELQFKSYEYDEHSNATCSLKGMYLAVTVLSAVRTNQLSARSIKRLFDYLLESSTQINAGDKDTSAALFWVDPLQDTGAHYAEPFGAHLEQPISEHAYSLELSKLSKLIREAERENSLPAQLTRHLLPILSKKPERFDKRQALKRSGPGFGLSIAIGLSKIHQLLSDGQSFKTFVGTERNFVPKSDSPFSFEEDDKLSNSTVAIEPDPQLSIVNKSDSGFCISWKGDIPGHLESGQIVAISDKTDLNSEQQNDSLYEIGVVRWVKRFKSSARIGIQIIARSARPAAVSQSFDMGGHSDFVRALLLPADHEGNTSFITTQSVVRPFSKVKLFDGVDESRASTDECILATSRARQFTYLLSNHDNE